MGGRKSKIPGTTPGNLLLYTGIIEFDQIYAGCERSLHKLAEYRSELDIRTTDFIKSLGAEHNWERSGELKDIVYKMLVVLSVVANGNLESLKVEYTAASPYLKVDLAKLSSATRRMMSHYDEMANFMSKLPTKLMKISATLEDGLIKATGFVDQIADRTRAENYTMKDRLLAIKHANHNYELICKAPSELTQLLTVTKNAKKQVRDLCSELTEPTHANLLVARGVRAHAEGLRTPAQVIRRFWPTT